MMGRKALKIAIFINTYKPVKNGVVISTSLIREGLIALGHIVHIYTLRYPNAKEEEGVVRFPAIKLPNLEFSWPLLPLRKRVLEALRGESYDLFLLEHPFLLGVIGLEEGKRRGIPTVFTFHTQYKQYLHYFPLLPARVKEMWLERHLRAFFREVDKVIVPSRSFIGEAIAYGVPQEKIHHIPNPVDLKRFSPPSEEERKKLREKYGLPLRAKVIGFIGRLALEKNLLELLDVFELLMKRREEKDIHLAFVGGGPMKKVLMEEVRKRGLSHHVSFIGPLEPEVVPEAHKLLDLFVTCSLSEVKPLAYLEAFATGVPIIAYDSQGANDTIENMVNGVLIPPGDKESMVEAISKVLGDRNLWKNLSRGALETAQNYSLEVVARKYQDLFTRLVRSS